MSGLIDIPFLKIFVKNEFLRGTVGLTNAYAFAVKSFHNRPLLFTVHTEDGAVFSDLPLHALVLEPPTIEYLQQDIREPWGCLGERISVIEHVYLKGYEPLYIGPECGDEKCLILGRYLMTFYWLPQGGFQEDPEQAKAMHLVGLEDGHLALWPNNYLKWPDKHFATKPLGKYVRNKEYWLANG